MHKNETKIKFNSKLHKNETKVKFNSKLCDVANELFFLEKIIKITQLLNVAKIFISKKILKV